MADFEGTTIAGLSDQAGVSGSRHTLAGVGSTASTTRPTPPTSMSLSPIPSSIITGDFDQTLDCLVHGIPVLDFESSGEETGPGIHWFEKLLAWPSRIELGNMLSTVVRGIEIYSTYRDSNQSLLTATNNAGTGISFPNLPSLPATIMPMEAQTFNVQVLLQGQPTIDGTLDFTTSVDNLSIVLTGNRVVMMAYEPDGSIQETIEFLTDILRSANGKEQRIRVRNRPRRIIDYNFKIEEGEERRRLETFLYTWHPQIFGIPLWFESQRLTTAASSGNTTIYFNTAYSDFRDGGLLIIWQDYQTFDALEIDTVSANSITLTSELTMDHPIGTKVMPLQTAITKQEISGDKFPVNLHTLAIKFYATSNETDIESTTAFNSHNSKVMFNDYNWISRETVTDTLKNLIHRMDNLTGEPIQFSDWDNSHFVSSKGFFCKNPQAVWEMRQVLHALAGRQKSFYLPTFYFDLIVKEDLASGSDLMDVELTGYTDYIAGREPNKSLHIALNNGTIITRQVNSSSVVDDTTERLVMDTVWSSDISVSDIKQVSFLRLCRFANDQFNINHNNSGQATLRATVQGVLQ